MMLYILQIRMCVCVCVCVSVYIKTKPLEMDNRKILNNKENHHQQNSLLVSKLKTTHQPTVITLTSVI